MTSFSEVETVKLVESIRQYPVLFEPQQSLQDSWGDENLRDDIWKSIADSLDKSVPECRKKWKLIRDSYNRFKRKQKSAPARNSKWYLYEHLSFLENIPSKLEISADIVDEYNTNSSLEAVDVKEEPLSFEDTFSMEVMSTTGIGPQSDTSALERSVQINTNFGKQIKRIVKKKEFDDELPKLFREKNKNRQLLLQEPVFSQHSCQQPVDEISLFSKYIEMSLRKLSVHLRSKAKTEIFNTISKYEMIHIEGENVPHNYSSSVSNATTSPVPERFN